MLAAAGCCCPRANPANMPPEAPAAEVAAAGAAGAGAELAGVPNEGVPNAAPGVVDQLKAPPVEAAGAVALLLPKAGRVELPKAGADAGVPKVGADAPNAGAAVPKTGAADGVPNAGAEAAAAPKAGPDAAGAPNAAPKPLEVPKPPNSNEPAAAGADAAAVLPNPAGADANPAAGDDKPNGAGAGLLEAVPAAVAALAAPVDRMMQRTCSGCQAAHHHMQKLGSCWLAPCTQVILLLCLHLLRWSHPCLLACAL